MSSFIDNNLMHDERVVYRTRPHWIIFGSAIGFIVGALAMFLVGPFTTAGQWHVAGHKLFVVLGVIALVCAMVTGLVAYIDYISSEFGITNKRVLIKLGFISRQSLEVLLPKIESIAIIQSIPGRVFSYGTIVISGTGGSKDAFRNIPYPLQFRKLIQEQVDEYEEEHL